MKLVVSERAIRLYSILAIVGFIIIVLSSISMVILEGQDFGVAFWVAWTYVADSGLCLLVSVCLVVFNFNLHKIAIN